MRIGVAIEDIDYREPASSDGDPGDIPLSGEFNLPLRYDAKVDQEAKAEAAKFFASDLQK